MIPLGFSGGSQDRLMVLADAAIRWTVGTADGATEGQRKENPLYLSFSVLCLFKLHALCVSTETPNTKSWAVGFVRSFGQ